MPELPEVETIKRGLDNIIVKQKIQKITVFNPKSFVDQAGQNMVGLQVIGVRRRAKLLIIDLEKDLSLAIHLKMTGQVIFRSKSTEEAGFAGGHPTKSMEQELPDKSTRVEIDFENGKLFFNDQRKFGWMQLMKTSEIDSIPFLKKAGPDFNEPGLKFEVFKQRIKRHPKMKIKAALLDQEIAAGLGNIYADEALAVAHSHPARLVSSLNEKEMRAIFEAARQVLTKGIELNGSSWRNYRDASGERGSYLDQAYAYGRAGQPCLFCGTPLEKTKIAGRGTVFCPNCQKI